MSNDFQYPHDLHPDHTNNNDLLFSNNDLNGGFGASGPVDNFSQAWDANQPDFFAPSAQGQSDTFGWSASSALQQPHLHGHNHQQPHHSRTQPQPSQAFNNPTLSTNSHQQQLHQNASSLQPRYPYSNATAIDPSFIQSTASSALNTHLRASNPSPVSQHASSTITPEALHNRSSSVAAGQNNAQATQQLHTLSTKVPKGTPAGPFVVVTPEGLHQQLPCRHLNSFLSVGTDPLQLPISGSNIPIYNPRKSRAQIQQLLSTNKSLNAVAVKKPSKKADSLKPVSRAARLQTSGRPAGSVVKQERGASESDDSSEYTDSESDEEPEAAPIPAERPLELKAGTRYDSIKTLWRPRNKAVTADSIREALKLFWEDLKAIRERWKADQDNVEAAEERKARDLPVLKERAQSQRQLLEIALKSAVQFGHPDILAHFGRSKAVLQILNVFLRDRNKAADYNGSLSQAVLEFVARSGTIDLALFKELGLDKVLGRFSSRGDASIKAIIKQINSNTTSGGPKKVSAVASTTSVESGKHVTPSNGVVKRPLSASESTSAQPTKKTAISPASNSPVKEPIKKAVATASLKSTATPAATAAAKPKVNQIYAKPSGYFSSLQSAKKPTLSASAKAAEATKPPVASAKPASKSTTLSASSDFSFSSMLASVNVTEKPKKIEQKAEVEQPQVDESPEEKAQRLRKEKRRRLRVSWAPEDSLVKVKYFEHDPEEELGHDAAQTRDVGNLKSESIMFKHMSGTSLDIEDDEDGDAMGGDPFIREWHEPKAVSFADIPEAIKAEVYGPYCGGMLKVDSPEATANGNREANVLLVVYTDDSEIPSSPKEVGAEAEELDIDPTVLGAPKEYIQKRMADIKQTRERNKALSAEISSLFSSVPAPPKPAAAQTDIASLLSTLQSQAFVPPPAPALPPQIQPPQPQSGQQDISAILAALNQQPPSQAQPYQPLPQQSPTPDLNALLATLNANQQQASVPPQMGSMNLFGATQPWQQPQASQAWNIGQAAPNATGGIYENPERKRFRDQNDSDDMRSGKRPFVPGYKTLPCKYYQEGKCLKGDNCTYRHDE